MKQAILLHNPRCSKSRAAFTFLNDHSGDFEVREYLKYPLSLSEIKEIASKLAVPPIEFMRTKEVVFVEKNLKNKSEEELLQAMVDHPILIERPILVLENKATVGRPLENI